MRIRLEDLLQQEFTDAECLVNVAEVEGTRVKGTTRIGLVDEVHVVSGHLLRGCGEVVEMKVWDAARPVGVDIRHVHPGGKRPCKGVQQAFFWLIDFGDAKDVVNVTDDGEAGRGDQVSCCVARICSVGVDV